MNRETQNLILLCIGLMIGKATLDGSFERYVQPVMKPYLLVSAAILVALALISMYRDMRSGGPLIDDPHNHGGKVLWLLAVPILVVFFLVPPALSPSDGRAANASAVSDGDLAPIPDGPAPDLSVFDIVQYSFQPDSGGLSGREVAVTGYFQIIEGTPSLAQVTIICCAADARTFRMELTGDTARLTGAAPESWWKVTGTVVDGTTTTERRFVPQFEVTSVQPADPPANPYSY